MCTYIKFSARLYIAQTAIVKIRTGSPKTARNEELVRTKGHTGSKISKTSEAFMHVMDCSCAPILRFFSAASDGATANRQIPDRIFSLFFYQFDE